MDTCEWMPVNECMRGDLWLLDILGCQTVAPQYVDSPGLYLWSLHVLL